MSHEQTFHPEPEDPAASTQQPPASPATPSAWHEPAAAPVHLPRHSGTRAQEQVLDRGISMELNSYGHYAVGLGAAAAFATAIMYVASGVLIAYVAMAVGALYFGVRGWNAAARGFATNGRTAAVGMALGALTLVAIVVFLVLQAVEVDAMLDGAA